MSGLEAIVREQERMAKKQKLCRKQTLVDIEHVIKLVEATSEQLKAEGMFYKKSDALKFRDECTPL